MSIQSTNSLALKVSILGLFYKVGQAGPLHQLLELSFLNLSAIDLEAQKSHMEGIRL